MATQAKFNTVLPHNTIQQGLNYTEISTVYANSVNTTGQAENVMTANDVELSLNTWSPGATASINIPASYKLLGNMYLKLRVKLSTLLSQPGDASSQTYKDIYDAYSGKALISGNVPPKLLCLNQYQGDHPTDDPPVLEYDDTSNVEEDGNAGWANRLLEKFSDGSIKGKTTALTGSLTTGLPMDISFLAYQLIKQFTWRIPGCDRLYIQGIRMLPVLLDKCPNEEEKQKLAMLSGSGHHLYSYNMTKGTASNLMVQWKRSIADIKTLGLTGDDQFLGGNNNDYNVVSSLQLIEDPEFVIYALLDLPWSTIDKDKHALYYPSHMTSSALELNIQFQDRDKMIVNPQGAYSGYQVDITAASLRFTYANVATLTYYKPPVYKMPCSLHYDFEFPINDFDQTPLASTNLLGLKNGEITQLLMFIHQAEGATAADVGANGGLTNSGTSMRFRWRNEPLKNIQVEYAGQIIWKGRDDGYDFMNQFDNRKAWSAFKMPSLVTSKFVLGDSERTLQIGEYVAGVNVLSDLVASQTAAGSHIFTGYDMSRAFSAVNPIYSSAGATSKNFINANDNAAKGINALISDFYRNRPTQDDGKGQLYQSTDTTAASNGYDISLIPLTNATYKLRYNNTGDYFNEDLYGIADYKKAIYDGPLFMSSGSLPFTKINRWHVPFPEKVLQTSTRGTAPSIFGNPVSVEANSYYCFGDTFHWTVIPVAEKIDQIRGPRDYALGADFKDSNLTVRFDGMDALKTSLFNSSVLTKAKAVKWNLHVVASITSAFIFNGDRAELMQ